MQRARTAVGSLHSSSRGGLSNVFTTSPPKSVPRNGARTGERRWLSIFWRREDSSSGTDTHGWKIGEHYDGLLLLLLVLAASGCRRRPEHLVELGGSFAHTLNYKSCGCWVQEQGRGNASSQRSRSKRETMIRSLRHGEASTSSSFNGRRPGCPRPVAHSSGLRMNCRWGTQREGVGRCVKKSDPAQGEPTNRASCQPCTQRTFFELPEHVLLVGIEVCRGGNRHGVLHGSAALHTEELSVTSRPDPSPLAADVLPPGDMQTRRSWGGEKWVCNHSVGCCSCNRRAPLLNKRRRTDERRATDDDMFYILYARTAVVLVASGPV